MKLIILFVFIIFLIHLTDASANNTTAEKELNVRAFEYQYEKLNKEQKVIGAVLVISALFLIGSKK